MSTVFNPRIIQGARHLFLFGLLSVIVIACVTNASDLGNLDVGTPPALPGTPVDAVVVKSQEIQDALDVTGTLLAYQPVSIVSELTRKITSVNVKEGSTVKKGRLLFQLDDADLQAQLGRLRQQEKLALLNEERLKDLIAHDAIAQQDYDEAITNLKVVQAQIQELQVTIDKTRITAPFGGQIGMINIHEGAIVSVNTLLTDIEDNSLIKVEFSLPEKYANLVALGSKHTFTTASSQQVYTAKVSALAAKLSENTRTLLVRAVVPNPDGHLLPGQSARLHIALSTPGVALSVTSNALIPSSKGYTVYVSRNHQAQAVPVTIGQRSANSVEILEGLNEGDTVITSNLLRLMPGAPVHLATIK